MNKITFEDIFGKQGVSEPAQKYELVKLSRRGVSKRSLLKLAELLSLPVNELAELLPVTKRTIQRYDNSEKFKSDVSEHVILIAEVILKGLEVFENGNSLKKWLKAPNKGLADISPIKLLDTGFGAQMVMDELGRVEHGVYS